MSEFVTNIEEVTLRNNDYRNVIYTSPNLMQLVIMNIAPEDHIGWEVHEGTDQFVRVEYGNGLAIIDRNIYKLTNGTAVVIPAGSYHDIVNTSLTDPLKIYLIYSPPQHRSHLIQKVNPRSMKHS